MGRFSQTCHDLPAVTAAYDGAGRDAGLPPPATQPVCRECFIGADGEDALAICRPALLYKYKAYASWGNANVGGDALEKNFDAFIDSHFIVGDLAKCRDQIARTVASMRSDHMILRMNWPGLDPAETLRSIERAARLFN
jgi:alkanesulfonate monooxygenase SsuD/methylene tetrahydromethanopterin reductase-like flavin-dependent oxidoreductase (luciferase family)